MRGTERYHQARLSKAKPVVLAYVGSDTAMRCFGKQTPLEAWLDSAYDAVEWRACVLSFGDFREALTAESSEMFSALVETEMTAYTLTLDNTDGYFTRLAGREQLLGGRIILVQGFDWPDFAASDFLPLFYGQITGFKNNNKQTVINADQSLKAETPEEPDVTSTKTYALVTTSVTESAAEEEFTYEELTPFFSQESWEITIEIVRDGEAEEVLLEVVEATTGNPSVEIGVNADGNYYLTYSEDITVAETKTIEGPAAGEGSQKVTVSVNGSNGDVVIDDGSGTSVSTKLETDDKYTFDSDIIASVSQPKKILVDVQSNIYVLADGDKKLLKYNSSGALLSELISYGPAPASYMCRDEYGNIYLSSYDNTYNSVRKYNSDGELQWTIGGGGSGDGQFGDPGPAGLAVSPGRVLYVCDNGNSRIQYFDIGTGEYIGQWGSYGTGDGQFKLPKDLAFDSLGNCFIVDYLNNCVKVFSSPGVFAYKFGEGDFNTPVSIHISGLEEVFVADTTDNCIYWYTAIHELFGVIGDEDANFFGVATDTIIIDEELENVLYGSDFVSSGGILRYIWEEGLYKPPSFSVTTTSVVKMGRGNTNSAIASAVIKGEDGEPVMAYENVGDPAATELKEIVGDGTLDLPLGADAGWEEFGYVDTYTATVVDTIENFTAETFTELETTENYVNETGEKLDSYVLPLPYGDLIENSDNGVWIAPCIQSDPPHYCVAGWPILPVESGNAISVYVDGVRRTSGWRFMHYDYQSQGEIALIVFDDDYPEAESVVTVRCKGKVDDAGALITNPIDVIEDFLNYVAAQAGTTWIPNAASFAKARNDAATYGYTCAGVITANVKLGEWLQNVLNSFLGAFQFNSDGELEVWLQPMDMAEEVHEEILEYEAISLEAEQSADNICKQVILDYALTLTGAEKAYYRQWREASARTVGDVWELSFDWCRNDETINMIVNILLSLYADPEWVISYQGQDCKFLPLDMRDQVEATLSLIVDEDGAIVADVPYSLREKTVNLDDFTTTLIAQSVNFIQLAANPPGAVYISWDRVYINGDPVFIERVL